MTRFLVRLAVTAGLAICGWLLGLAFSAAAMAAEPGMDEVGEAETDSTVLDGGVDKTTDLVSSTVEGVTSTTRQVTSSALETVNTTTAAVTDAAGVEPVQDTVETVTNTVDNTVGTVTDSVNDVVDTAEKTVDGTVGAVTDTVDVVTEPVPVPVEPAPEQVTKEQVPAKAPVGKTEKPARESAAKVSGDDVERSRPREAARPEFRLAEVTQHADPATASGLKGDGHPGSPLPSAPGGVAATAVAGDSAAKKLGIVAVDPATTGLQRTGFGSTLPAAAVVAASALPCTSPD